MLSKSLHLSIPTKFIGIECVEYKNFVEKSRCFNSHKASALSVNTLSLEFPEKSSQPCFASNCAFTTLLTLLIKFKF